MSLVKASKQLAALETLQLRTSRALPLQTHTDQNRVPTGLLRLGLAAS